VLLRLALVLVAGSASGRGRRELCPGVLLVGHGCRREEAHKTIVARGASDGCGYRTSGR